MTASQLCKATGIPDSKVYYTLANLQRKGLIQVQEGTPSLYEAVEPKNAVRALRQQVETEFQTKLDLAESLVQRLEPLHEKAEGEQIEIAYVVRGQRNISRKIQQMIGSARKDILVLLSNATLLESVAGELAEARRKRVTIRGAVPSGLLEAKPAASIGRLKTLVCDCDLILTDGRSLLSVSNWHSANAYGILTMDSNMVAMATQYYDSPACCR
jgi:sugar-specific transcriptional regulator TrmB